MKATIRRSLGVESTDCSDTEVLAAYAAVHTEVDGLIKQAEAQAGRASALLQGESVAITVPTEQFPLSKRDVAGIAGQVLLDIRTSVEQQTDMSDDFIECLRALAIKVRDQGITAVSVADFAVLARPTLDALGISPSPADLQAIGKALLGYIPVMQADMAKLQSMDFSPPKIAAIAPPLPTRQVTWRDLFEAWRRSTGGVLEVDGYGVSQQRELPYQVSIREFTQEIGDVRPSELTSEQARRYVTWLQEESGLSVRTMQARMTCLRNLLKVGLEDGLISSNPFSNTSIRTPAGVTDQQGYRPFTKQELIAIFTELKTRDAPMKRMLLYILLCTGCRLSDALQIRTTDLKRTSKGVWFFDWRHEPTGALPVLLKSKTKNNRQTPVHKRLLDEGLLHWKTAEQARLLGNNIPTTSAFSNWFKGVLRKLEIYESKKTVLHSLRGTAKDLWREASIPVDVRSALTGHVSKDVGEASYGAGLQMQPEVLAKELAKVNLDWLP